MLVSFQNYFGVLYCPLSGKELQYVFSFQKFPRATWVERVGFNSKHRPAIRNLRQLVFWITRSATWFRTWVSTFQNNRLHPSKRYRRQMKMDVLCSSQAFVRIYQTARCHSPEDSDHGYVIRTNKMHTFFPLMI